MKNIFRNIRILHLVAFALVVLMASCAVQKTQTETPPADDTKTGGEETIVVQQPEYRGDLDITSIPDGADILVDDEVIGTTPTKISLEAGDYNLKIIKEGYVEHYASVSILKDQVTSLSVNLTMAVAEGGITYGNLSVTSNPAQAQVYIDGGIKGTTNIRIPGISPGQHNIRLTKSGYYDYTGIVVVSAGKVSSFHGDLKVIPPTNVTITATENGTAIVASAKLYDPATNELVREDLTPVNIIRMKPGNYSLTVSKPLYADFVQEFTLEPGQVLEINADMVKG
ncbi:PEGA domain-containing protein [Candidatus Woesearchaeota archaeon]|nr:PEGA domain-containing protein [Candidatus Woesearchaeota archaeon]